MIRNIYFYIKLGFLGNIREILDQSVHNNYHMLLNITRENGQCNKNSQVMLSRWYLKKRQNNARKN